MPKWRRWSGADVLRVLAGFGFQKLSQRGSHVKVRRYLQDGSRQSLTVPLHDEMDSGYTPSIDRQPASYQNPNCAGTFRRSETGSPRATPSRPGTKSYCFRSRLPFSVDYDLPIDGFRNQERTEELMNEAEVCERRNID